MSLPQSILKNTFVLTAGTLSAKILAAVFVAFLARAVGPGGVGKYVYASSLIAIFMLLPNFGFDTLFIREVAKQRDKSNQYVENILAIKLILMFVTLLLLISFLVLKQYDGQTVQIILLVMISAALGSILETFYSVFRAFERMEYEAALVVVNNVLMVLFGIAAIKIGLSLNGIVVALSIASGLSFLVAMYVIRRHFTSVMPKINPEMLGRILKDSIPFGVLVIIEVVFINTDTLMIAKLQGEIAVGWYSAATRILMLFLLIPGRFMNAIFPVLSRLSGSSRESLRQTYSKSYSYLLMLAFPLAVGGFLTSDQIIIFIYGEQFQNSVLVFEVMIWVIMFSFVGYVNGATLIAIGKERLLAIVAASATIANIFLDYFLIKGFGYVGACYATLILTGLGFIIYSTICFRELGIKPDVHIIGKSLLASLIMGSVIFILKRGVVNLIILIPGGILVYCGVILLLGTLPRNDLRALRNLAYK